MTKLAPMKQKNRYISVINKNKVGMPKVTPICKHYFDCGGCSMQEFSHADQLAIKEKALKELIADECLEDVFEGVEIKHKASPKFTHYRQRMDYVFAFDNAGLRGVKGHTEVLDLEECFLPDKINFKIFQKTIELARQNNLESYSYLTHIGFLRYVTVRKSREGLLVSLLTVSTHFEPEMLKVMNELEALPEVDSVHWLIHEGMSDSSFGAPHKFVGKEFITETFHGKSFQIGPNTFFQANAEMAEYAYGCIRDNIKKHQAKKILDLYSGTATIATIISDLADHVTAVENFIPNEEYAKINLNNNNIQNVDFVTTETESYLQKYKGSPEYIVVNPPRIGVHEKALRRIIDMKTPNISYLSCNPITLMEDLGILSIHYDIEEIILLDMFPQTPHFETLVHLTKRSSMRI